MVQDLEVRVGKLDKLRNSGHDPYYPANFSRDYFIGDLRIKYESLEAGSSPCSDEFAVAGRVISIRDLGKTIFFDLKDQSGKIQVNIRQDVVGEKEYNTLRDCLDQGDWLGIRGKIFRARRGELTVKATNYRFLTKAIRSLPLGKETENERYHKIEDMEIIYRQPEIGMATDSLRFETLRKRAQIIKAIREYLWKIGFDETDIPILETVYGGANARPFITKVNALDGLEVFLRISLELPLKRLIVGGFDGVFHIGHVFRNEGIDRNHNPEFSLLEVYKALWDYTDMMRLTEDLIVEVAKRVNGNLEISYGDKKIDLTPPWRRITMNNALREYTGVDVDRLGDLNDGSEKEPLKGNLVAKLFEESVQHKLIRPTFVIDHPKETSPLCKRHRNDHELIERFELFINSWEIANSYSELNDPILQRQLLEEQAKELRAGKEEAMPMDENFVGAIEFGMPTTGGLGIGIDRLVMLLVAKYWPKDNPPNIKDVIFFPLMKPKQG